jgi:NAD(P)-dependent dehydrogenase (short-subunit alcohol dehydrogenase family)
MTEDQHTQQDPTQQYHQPDQQPEQELEHPGLESEMQPTPDYGEDTYRGSGRLEGRAAIVTGGDSGIGRAVALAFAREGADVLISYLPEEEPDAQETARVVEDSGKKAVKMPGDIGEEAHCQRLVEQAISEFGKIDILVNNAAYQMYREGLQSISAEELEHTYRTNVFSMFYLCKAALPHMQPGSSIVNTCSVEAYQPQPMLLDYASTKAAIVNFTKGLAMEVAQQGIRAHSGHHARRVCLPVRSAGVSDKARRPACGARSGLCLPGFPGGQLREWRDLGRDRRDPSAVENHPSIDTLGLYGRQHGRRPLKRRRFRQDYGRPGGRGG